MIMKTFRILILSLSCLFFFSFSSFSQKKWTLEECIAHAIDHNITVKRIELLKKNAEISLNTSQMSRLPNLNAGIGQNWNFGRTQVVSGLYEDLTQSNTSFSVSSSIPIFTGFRIPNEIAQGKLEVKAALESLARAKEEISLSVASLYLQVLFSKELLKVAEEQLALSKLQLGNTQALFEAGKVPKSQLYDIEAQIAKDEVSVVQAENNLKLDLLNLAQSLELQDTEVFDIYEPVYNDVIDEFMSSIQPPRIIFDSALKYKPVIKEQEYKLQSAEKGLKIAQSAYWPMLNMGLGYGTNYFYSYDYKDLNSSFSSQFKNNAGEYISLSLSIPIFNRFSVRNQVRSARVNIDNQQLALDDVKKNLYKEIESAYLSATSAQEKYRASGRAVKSTGESFEYARERYEIGKSTVFEFNEARTKFIQSQSEEIQAKYDYIFRAKILDFYNGIPIRL